MTKQESRKAFRIEHPFSLPGGRRYSRTNYYVAQSRGEEEVLTRAQFAHELADGAPPAPSPPPAPVQPPPDPKTTAPARETSSEHPDWSFMTIASMRAWLDRAEVRLPAQGANKTTYESLCADAFTAGRRPHPLYGFPGGPQPSPGIAGPVGVEDPASFARAIEAAHSGGFTVPEATQSAFAALTAPATPEESEGAEPGPREDAGEPADATISGDPTEDTSPALESQGSDEQPRDTTESVEAYVATLTTENLDGLVNGDVLPPEDVLSAAKAELQKRDKSAAPALFDPE